LISYAQNFEDVMLARVFKDRTNGFYVDVGAADPINLSVTKWFYDLGWSGLNIEPNSTLFARLTEARPRDINLNCGAGAAHSEALFFEQEVDELSSFDPDVQRDAQHEGRHGSARTVSVAPLTDLLNTHCPGRSIDFLKIDVEGWEMEVLKGLDLRLYRPTVILVEATAPRSQDQTHLAWEPIILGGDYSFVYFDGLNRFYVANEKADLKRHFAVPPNVFDEFEVFPLIRARTDAEQRLDAMNRLDQFIRERDAIIAERNSAVHDRDVLINEKNIALADRDARIGQGEVVIADKDALIEQAQRAILENEADLLQKDAIIAGKDLTVEEKDHTIKERNAQIEKQAAIIAEKEAAIATRETIINQMMRSRAGLENTDKLPRTVAVDLTPVLPGGENGGAKVFVLELLRRMAELAPQTQFVLLTQASAHDELATLDRANVRRLLLLTPDKRPAVKRLAARISNVIANLPPPLARRIERIGYSVLTTAKRSSSRSILRSLNADLLFCPFTAPTYFEPGIPTVSVIYDLQYKTYPEFFSPQDVVHRARTFEEAARKSTLLVAISDYSRNAAIAEGKLSPGAIETIYLHVSRHSLRNAMRDDNILSRFQLVPGKYLIYPANFWKHKNHEMLLTAFGLARQRGLAPDVRLVCTGAPGERQTWLKHAADGLGLKDHVLFPGYVSNAEMLTLMTNSAGMVFPSLYEGFGLPVVEAMVNRVPVACSNVTSLPEIAGEAAILFNPRIPEEIADAMIALTQDGALTKRLLQAGNLRAAIFSDSSFLAQQYLETFQRAMGSHGQSDILVGVHADGWIGTHCRIQTASSEEPRTLHLHLALPEWTPIPKTRLLLRQERKTTSDITILRGQEASVSIALPTAGGYFDVNLSAHFVPALTGLGVDTRELSVMLTKCEITSPNGPAVVLFPNDTPP
jgi:FkbM family methyltransferase